MLRGLKQSLCASGPRTLTESETELCLSVSCGGAGQQWSAVGTGALGAADLGMVQALLEEVAINPTIELPELTQGWKIDSWGAQTEPCAPGERSSDPTRDCSGLVCVSRSLQQRRGSVVACGRVGGTGCSSTCMGPFEGGPW